VEIYFVVVVFVVVVVVFVFVRVVFELLFIYSTTYMYILWITDSVVK